MQRYNLIVKREKKQELLFAKLETLVNYPRKLKLINRCLKFNRCSIDCHLQKIICRRSVMGDDAGKSSTLFQPLWRSDRLRCNEEQRIRTQPRIRICDIQ